MRDSNFLTPYHNHDKNNKDNNKIADKNQPIIAADDDDLLIKNMIPVAGLFKDIGAYIEDIEEIEDEFNISAINKFVPKKY